MVMRNFLPTLNHRIFKDIAHVSQARNIPLRAEGFDLLLLAQGMCCTLTRWVLPINHTQVTYFCLCSRGMRSLSLVMCGWCFLVACSWNIAKLEHFTEMSLLCWHSMQQNTVTTSEFHRGSHKVGFSQVQGHMSHVTVITGKKAMVTESSSRMLLHPGLLCGCWFPQRASKTVRLSHKWCSKYIPSALRPLLLPNPTKRRVKWCNGTEHHWAQTHFQRLQRKESALAKMNVCCENSGDKKYELPRYPRLVPVFSDHIGSWCCV